MRESDCGRGCEVGSALRALVAIVVLAIAVAAAPCAAGAEAPVQPYGTNDAGGFRNVLPAGENGPRQRRPARRIRAHGTYPPHFDDQLPLYAEPAATRRRR